MWSTASETIEQGLVTALSYPLSAEKRLFWLFLLSAAVLALWVTMQRREMTLGRVCQLFFNKKYWLNRSTFIDVSLLVGNSIFRVALLVPLFGGHLLATMWVAHSLQSNLGNAVSIAMPWWLIALCYSSFFFLLEDFSRFWLHSQMHRWPLLWRWHRVHHSATVLTPLTLRRVHPFEMVLYYLRGLVVFAGVSGIFVYQFGRQLSALDILGVDALGFLFNLAGANLRHSHIWLGFGRGERWFISPAQHQLHHSASEEHRDCNFGSCLAIWDKKAGSWIAAQCPQHLRFGLGVQCSEGNE